MKPVWLTSSEALARLGSKPQTLYANVSRGRVRAKRDPADSRRSLYRAEDVERLASRAGGRRSTAAVAAGAVHWGDPVLPSALSTIEGGRLYYRGEDAVKLSAAASLEDVARLLWGGGWAEVRPPPLRETGSLGAAFAALADRIAGDGPSHGRSVPVLRNDAGAVLATLGDALTGPGPGPLHIRLARHWGRPEAADDLRRALVLLADHELNASTFAARVAVSTGASLAASALAGLATLSGPLHGTAASAVPALAERAGAIGPDAAVLEVLAEGRRIPAFGHPLYPEGDVRSVALLGRLEVPRVHADLIEAVERIVGERPNVDMALTVLTTVHRLPSNAPFTIFALARSVGWLAHMLEQAAAGHLIRPRAHYTGPAVGSPHL